MNKVISVIVPVYNVAAYLPQAIESILNQDYRQLEVILIDDGSRDESGAICDRYAALDSRIQVIHQKNAGAAAAKNAGLRAATGEYLSVVDSDDYLEPNVYSYMVDIMEREQADVVQCALRYVYKNRREDVILHPGRHRVDALTYLTRFTKDWTCAITTDKLHRRSLYDGIFFEEGHRIDDEYFTYQGMMNARKIVTDDRVIYNYRCRRSSAMHSPQAGEQLMLDRVDFTLKRRDHIVERFPQLQGEFDFNVMESLLYFAQYPDNTAATLQVLKREMKTYLRTPGRTRPPKFLWLPILKLLFSGTERLKAGFFQREEGNLSDYYD